MYFGAVCGAVGFLGVSGYELLYIVVSLIVGSDQLARSLGLLAIPA